MLFVIDPGSAARRDFTSAWSVTDIAWVALALSHEFKRVTPMKIARAVGKASRLVQCESGRERFVDTAREILRANLAQAKTRGRRS